MKLSTWIRGIAISQIIAYIAMYLAEGNLGQSSGPGFGDLGVFLIAKAIFVTLAVINVVLILVYVSRYRQLKAGIDSLALTLGVIGILTGALYLTSRL